MVDEEGGHEGRTWWMLLCGCVAAFSSRTSPGGARLAAIISTKEQLRSLLRPRAWAGWPGRADKQRQHGKKLKIDANLETLDLGVFCLKLLHLLK